MTQFDMDKFVGFLNGKKGKTESSETKQSLPKLRYFKPELGEQVIRWLPFVSPEGNPAYCVYFYDNQAVFGERRSIAPFQFGLEDPIAEYVEGRRKQGKLKEEEFKNVMKISPRPSWFVPILVRGKEEEGAFLWELSDKKFKEFALATVANAEYRDEPIIDPNTGRDLTITVREGSTFFNGKRVKEWTPTVKIKQSKVAKSDAELNRIMSSIQDPVAYNKQYLRKTEYYQNLLATSLAFFANGNAHADGAARGTVERQPAGSRDALESALDSAFDDDTF